MGINGFSVVTKATEVSPCGTYIRMRGDKSGSKVDLGQHLSIRPSLGPVTQTPSRGALQGSEGRTPERTHKGHHPQDRLCRLASHSFKDSGLSLSERVSLHQT